ncbi:response regulator transcription factor [Arthrobacter sp. CG_A4]|uniref:response regulator transcription factor n=1 Tax=Arthrobacter sp. CG_A4 TaxID=3071706 RepID=UPI002E060A3A|nr:two-component system nitrate/nitrite response regulator NarL [Arthrobacter sp. CG_A4]
MHTVGSRVRIVVADDHPLFRRALVQTIRDQPEFELVGQASDGGHAMELIRELSPNVAVLDIRMPVLDGLQVVNALCRDELSTRVILLSAYVDGSVAFDAVAAGASAYLSKSVDPQLLTDTIRAVSRGETVLGSDVQASLAAEIRLRGAQARPALSKRELEILVHVAGGRSAPQIAELLFLSTPTIKSHLQGLYEKLGVSDRAAAVAEGMRRGLLE